MIEALVKLEAVHDSWRIERISPHTPLKDCRDTQFGEFGTAVDATGKSQSDLLYRVKIGRGKFVYSSDLMTAIDAAVSDFLATDSR